MSEQTSALRHDGSIDIATAGSRMAATWKNKNMLWSELVERLSRTQRTHETVAEYLAAKKTRQDEIKDVGGFVGGYLTKGRRRSGSVMHRQLITLDLDFANSDFIEDLELTYPNAAVVYSTHKHQPEAPRLRLIMPLSREVQADEYEAIARRIAGVLGIELFDTTTFQPERLMYWPSTPKDGEWVFWQQDGPWLDADALLATYRDWRDSSAWPVSERVSQVVERMKKHQGEPTEKPGLVGAFCRVYSIDEAITVYLSDVYEPCAIEGRYTYKHGSTAAGLVVYDDKFAYSHHGTDPVGGKLCNAFDLLRIHLYGPQDDNAREGTPVNKMPSHLAMLDLASKDEAVRRMVIAERKESALADFEGVEPADLPGTEDEPYDDSWIKDLETDRAGRPISTIDNVVKVLENDRFFKGRLAYDDFEKCEVALGDLPWRKITPATRRLTDKDDSNIRHYLERAYNISSSPKINDALGVLATRHAFHPVKDYLRSLVWDGQDRISTLLQDYLGAEDSEYVSTVFRKQLVAAVARVHEPGIKFDQMLGFIGPQGKKKSSLIKALGKQWFSDSFTTVEGKESFEQLQGVWIVELAELSALSRAENEQIKHFVSKCEDRYRVAFGKRTERFPRQCVFFFTANKRVVHRDPTGGRRYWPVDIAVQEPTKDVFTDLTTREIDQVWAQAVAYYDQGEKLYLEGAMLEKAIEAQKDHADEHPWTGQITEFLDKMLPANWTKMKHWDRLQYLQDEHPEEEDLYAEPMKLRDRVCVNEIWVECLRKKEAIDRRSANDIIDILTGLTDWEASEKPVKFSLYGTQRRSFYRAKLPDWFVGKNTGKAVTSV